MRPPRRAWRTNPRRTGSTCARLERATGEEEEEEEEEEEDVDDDDGSQKALRCAYSVMICCTSSPRPRATSAVRVVL